MNLYRPTTASKEPSIQRLASLRSTTPKSPLSRELLFPLPCEIQRNPLLQEYDLKESSSAELSRLIPNSRSGRCRCDPCFAAPPMLTLLVGFPLCHCLSLLPAEEFTLAPLDEGLILAPLEESLVGVAYSSALRRTRSSSPAAPLILVRPSAGSKDTLALARKRSIFAPLGEVLPAAPSRSRSWYSRPPLGGLGEVARCRSP
jgi:hypothetical protein